MTDAESPKLGREATDLHQWAEQAEQRSIDLVVRAVVDCGATYTKGAAFGKIVGATGRPPDYVRRCLKLATKRGALVRQLVDEPPADSPNERWTLGRGTRR